MRTLGSDFRGDKEGTEGVLSWGGVQGLWMSTMAMNPPEKGLVRQQHSACSLQRGSISAPGLFFFPSPHLCLCLPPLTKQSATMKAGVMLPLLIWPPFYWEPPRRQG